ncbi:regulator of chromosome condensation 1/beta-lactamase-inhibitor protein II [Pisolithus croceorrhizus]|nr:regulator of chromosome condensation 1/beta-lactamase-inhibitor protein II [Pisolithus croceorrhizus]
MSNPPLRRSTRAGSAKPEGAPVARAAPLPVVNGKHAVANPTKRTASQPTKRPKSPTSSPPKKRSRSAAPQSDTEDAKKSTLRKTSSGRRLTRKPTANGLPAVAEEPQQLKPYFNPIPSPPSPRRPAAQLFVWGAGNFGQFGMGPDFLGEFPSPKRNTWVDQKISEGVFGSEGAGLEAIAAGGLHTLFVDEKGAVWSCGVNDDAALGRITKDVPDPKNPGSSMDIDTLTAIPHPIQSLLDEKFRAVQITAGDSISAAISVDGELRVWGSFRAAEGSLGFSSAAQHEFFPRKILELSHKPGDIEKVVSVVAGNNHLVVLTTHGNVFTWGTGEHGQLGRKIIDRRKIHGTVPEKIALGHRSNRAVVIGAGNYCSFAVDEAGDVWGWGLNTMGQTGTGVLEVGSTSDAIHTPRKIHSLCKSVMGGEVVVQIAGGEHHTLFLTSLGRVFACGRCDGGQLGLSEDNPTYKSRPNPDFVTEPLEVIFDESSDPIVSIASGTHNNMAITRAGVLYAWGQESQGELGVKEVEAKTPTVVVRREGSFEAVAVACGGQHTLGLFKKKA